MTEFIHIHIASHAFLLFLKYHNDIKKVFNFHANFFFTQILFFNDILNVVSFTTMSGLYLLGVQWKCFR